MKAKILVQSGMLLLSLLTIVGCKKVYVPKPYAYFRISFPEKNYEKVDVDHLFSFEKAVYAFVQPDNSSNAEPNWYNLIIPENKATIHLSYKRIDGNLNQLTEESHELAYKHTIKASAIEEQLYIDDTKHVYGTIYEIRGNAASPLQFHLTDSVDHFLRGSLYIREVPNYDSIRPVIDFIEDDLIHLIETLNWN